MPEKAAFFHFYSAFCFIPREISGLDQLPIVALGVSVEKMLYGAEFRDRAGFSIPGPTVQREFIVRVVMERIGSLRE
jgi:hypothetical protein